jgi:hypothetical protein
VSKSASRPKRARRAVSRPTAGYSQETLPATALPPPNTAPEMTPALVPKQPA